MNMITLNTINDTSLLKPGDYAASLEAVTIRAHKTKAGSNNINLRFQVTDLATGRRCAKVFDLLPDINTSPTIGWRWAQYASAFGMGIGRNEALTVDRFAVELNKQVEKGTPVKLTLKIDHPEDDRYGPRNRVASINALEAANNNRHSSISNGRRTHHTRVDETSNQSLPKPEIF